MTGADDQDRASRRARLSQLQRTRAGAEDRGLLSALLTEILGERASEDWCFALPTDGGDELSVAILDGFKRARDRSSFSVTSTADRAQFDEHVANAFVGLTAPWVSIWLARLGNRGVSIMTGDAASHVAARLLDFDGDDVIMVSRDGLWGAHLERLDDGWSNYSYVTETWRAGP